MSAGLPVLWSFRRCPYAMRARLALTSAAIPLEHREVLLRDKPLAMLQASPKGTVPVLVDGPRVIDESLDIMHWALNQNDPENWLKVPDQAHILIEEADGPFKTNLDTYRYRLSNAIDRCCLEPELCALFHWVNTSLGLSSQSSGIKSKPRTQAPRRRASKAGQHPTSTK